MQYWCLYCSQIPERRSLAEKQFSDQDLEVNWWHSIHSKTFGLVGVAWPATDMVSTPHSVNAGYVGLAIGQWMLWQHLLLSDHPGPFLIFEDDVILCDRFKERLDAACDELPKDWEFVLVGNPWDKMKDLPPHVHGDVYTVGEGNVWGMHAVMVNRSALRFLMEENHRCELPIDAQLNKTAYRKMKTYAIIPSLAAQRSCLAKDDPRYLPCSCG